VAWLHWVAIHSVENNTLDVSGGGGCATGRVGQHPPCDRVAAQHFERQKRLFSASNWLLALALIA
jgi:hypothetical protein